jgi:hypothetical protein
VIVVVVAVAVIERAVMTIHFLRLLGVTARDLVLLRDIVKLALLALAAGLFSALVRLSLARENAVVVLLGCGLAFAAVYLPLAIRWLPVPRLVPLASRATSAGVSSR